MGLTAHVKATGPTRQSRHAPIYVVGIIGEGSDETEGGPGQRDRQTFPRLRESTRSSRTLGDGKRKGCSNAPHRSII